MASLTNGHELRKLLETVKDREACHAVVPGAGILHIECSIFHSIIFQDLE